MERIRHSEKSEEGGYGPQLHSAVFKELRTTWILSPLSLKTLVVVRVGHRHTTLRVKHSQPREPLQVSSKCGAVTAVGSDENTEYDGAA